MLKTEMISSCIYPNPNLAKLGIPGQTCRTVAQLASAAASKAEGWGFESLQSCHFLFTSLVFQRLGCWQLTTTRIQIQGEAMAKQATASDKKPNIFQRMQNFYSEVRLEMDKVTWPSRNDLMVSTKVTMYLLAIMAVILFAYDQVFQWVVFLWLNVAA